MSAQSHSSAPIPNYVSDLQAIYGAPSQAGFGSAMFYEPAGESVDLEPIALKIYRHFVGDLWERWSEAV